MGLILRIVRFDKNQPPAQEKLMLDAVGGSIGRNASNDWVLPDAQRYLSGRHAVIRFQNDNYYITDTSTNGVFINNKASPLGKDNSVLLTDRDTLKMGSYEIEVLLSNSAVSTPPDTGGDILPSLPSRKPTPSIPSKSVDPFKTPVLPNWSQTAESHPVDVLPDFNFGAVPSQESLPIQIDDPFFQNDHFLPDDISFLTPPLSKGEALPPSKQEEDPFIGLSSFFAPPQVKPAPLPHVGGNTPLSEPHPLIPDIREVGKGNIPSNEVSTALPLPEADVSPFSLKPALVNTEPEQTSLGLHIQSNRQPTPHIPPPVASPPPPPPVAITAQGIHDFLSGAGISDPEIQRKIAEHLSLELAGKLFGIMLQGTMHAIHNRAEIKSEMRMDMTTIQATQNNPIKFSATPEDAMQRLFLPQKGVYLSAENALHESFDDIKTHQIAVIAGVQAALKHILSRFSPEHLTTRLQKQSPISAMIPLQRHAKLWSLFEDLYASIEKEATDDFQKLFGIEFSRAYEQQIMKIKSTPQ